MKENGQLNYVGHTVENMNMIKKIGLAMLANEKNLKSSKKKMKKALIDKTYRELLLNI